GDPDCGQSHAIDAVRADCHAHRRCDHGHVDAAGDVDIALTSLKMQNANLHGWRFALLLNLPQLLRTNSDFRLIAPKPSILQSMSWSPSTRRIFLTLVPCLTTPPPPFSLRSLMTVTESPSCSR